MLRPYDGKASIVNPNADTLNRSQYSGQPEKRVSSGHTIVSASVLEMRWGILSQHSRTYVASVLSGVCVAALAAWAQRGVEPLAGQNAAMLALGCVAAGPERKLAGWRIVLA